MRFLVKLHVIYEQPKDVEGFEQHYFDVHVPLAEKMPNLQNISIQRVIKALNTDQNLYIVAELEFETLTKMNEAMSSKEGKEAVDDIKNLVKYLHKPPVMIIAQ
jgi:uncharacterized protein (TIGR02118 family)